MLAQELTQQWLDSDGSPRKPNSHRLQIRREYVDGVNFEALMNQCLTFTAPLQFIGMSECLLAEVQRVTHFPQGTLVHLRPFGSFYGNWPLLLLWVPPSGSCGILN